MPTTCIRIHHRRTVNVPTTDNPAPPTRQLRRRRPIRSYPPRDVQDRPALHRRRRLPVQRHGNQCHVGLPCVGGVLPRDTTPPSRPAPVHARQRQVRHTPARQQPPQAAGSTPWPGPIQRLVTQPTHHRRSSPGRRRPARPRHPARRPMDQWLLRQVHPSRPTTRTSDRTRPTTASGTSCGSHSCHLSSPRPPLQAIVDRSNIATAAPSLHRSRSVIASRDRHSRHHWTTTTRHTPVVVASTISTPPVAPAQQQTRRQSHLARSSSNGVTGPHSSVQQCNCFSRRSPCHSRHHNSDAPTVLNELGESVVCTPKACKE